MWEPDGNPIPLDLPKRAPEGTVGAWIRVRLTDPRDSVPDVSNLRFVNPLEASKFAMAKRAEEHASARWLVEHLLLESGRDPTLYNIERDDYRRPRLVGPDAPSLSITHSGGVAAVILGPEGADIGLDLEPVMARPRNLLWLMTSGKERQELDSLYDLDETLASERTTDAWVAKEAVQKAAGLGMGLPPQSFEVDGLDLVKVDYQSTRHLYELHRWKSVLNGRLTSLAIAEKKSDD
jgi:phosphopantetheinyl transferase